MRSKAISEIPRTEFIGIRTLRDMKNNSTYHMSRCVIPSEGILTHQKPQNKNVSFTIDSIPIISVEVCKHKLGTSPFRCNKGNEYCKNHNT